MLGRRGQFEGVADWPASAAPVGTSDETECKMSHLTDAAMACCLVTGNGN